MEKAPKFALPAKKEELHTHNMQLSLNRNGQSRIDLKEISYERKATNSIGI